MTRKEVHDRGAPELQQEDLFSIGDAAEACGISAETLRIWERRYGEPKPLRLPSGHRRFTGAQIRRLRRVSELLARGQRPGQVLRMSEEELEGAVSSHPGQATVPKEIVDLIELVRTFQGQAFIDRLRRYWRPDQCLAFLDDHLAPLIRAVGRAWADGEIEVRHEHVFTDLIQDLVRGFRMGYPLVRGAPLILLATLPGESHGLGLQMAALLCAANEVPIRILGVNTPPIEILRSAAELQPRAVALSVSLSTGGVDTDRTIASIRKDLEPDQRLLVGGEGARGSRRGPRHVEYVPTLASWDAAMKELANES